MILFVDSSAFIALTIRNDQHHRAAVSFVRGLASNARLLTSNFILDETMTHLASRLGPLAAYTFGDRLLQSSLHEVVDIDKALFHEAMSLLKKFRDKNLSFTDLTSFALMGLYKLRTAFSFDEDFAKAGFEIVPKE